MIKKHEIALMVNTAAPSVTANYKRICKSTELTIAMEAQTEEYDYIADESATTELEGYNPQIEQALKMIKSEDDFEFFWEKFYNMAVGEDAKVDGMIIFKFDKTTQGSGDSAVDYFKAWKPKFTIVFNEMACNDSELNFNLNVAGTISKGYVSLSDGGAPTWYDELPSVNNVSE